MANGRAELSSVWLSESFLIEYAFKMLKGAVRYSENVQMSSHFNQSPCNQEFPIKAITSPSRFHVCLSWSLEFSAFTNRELLGLNVTCASYTVSLHYWQCTFFCQFFFTIWPHLRLLFLSENSHQSGEFYLKTKYFPKKICIGFKLFMKICHIDNQNPA